MTHQQPDYGYDEQYPDHGPAHSAGYQMRRPRAWHVLALGTGICWLLGGWLAPAHCDTAPAASSSASAVAFPPEPTFSAPRSSMPDESGLGTCALFYPMDMEQQLRCGVAEGHLRSSVLDRVESALSSYATASAQAQRQADQMAQRQADAKAAATACRGTSGSLSDSLRWLTIILAVGAVVTAWRRGKQYLQHKKDCALAFDFDRKFPPGHEDRAPNDFLEAATEAGFAAEAEAFSQRVHWFGGNADADERRADQLRDIADRANTERKRRLGGGWVHGIGDGGFDLPAPVLPPTPGQSTSNPAPSGSTDWRSKLANSDEDW